MVVMNPYISITQHKQYQHISDLFIYNPLYPVITFNSHNKPLG